MDKPCDGLSSLRDPWNNSSKTTEPETPRGKWAFSLLYDVFFAHFVPLLLGIDFWIFLGGGCLAIEFAPCLAAQGRWIQCKRRLNEWKSECFSQQKKLRVNNHMGDPEDMEAFHFSKCCVSHNILAFGWPLVTAEYFRCRFFAGGGKVSQKRLPFGAMILWTKVSNIVFAASNATLVQCECQIFRKPIDEGFNQGAGKFLRNSPAATLKTASKGLPSGTQAIFKTISNWY